MSLTLVSAYGIGDKVTTSWYPQIDTTNLPPSSVFNINFGSIPIIGYSLLPNNKIVLTLSRSLSPGESVIFTYTPPGNTSDLKRPTPPGASTAILESAKAPEIRDFEVDNLTPKSEVKDNYNLAPSYPIVDNGTPDSAVVDDFIATYGYQEALQLSNINDASAVHVNERRIERAIDDAHALIDAYVEQAPKGNKLLISSSRRRTAMIIARYYLDSVRRRQDVTDDYERAIKELDVATDPSRGGLDPNNPDLAINNGGIMRYHLVPQTYNRETGKGLSGFRGDPGSDYYPDFRTGNEIYDNNDNSNTAPRRAQYDTLYPSDDGGLDGPNE